MGVGGIVVNDLLHYSCVLAHFYLIGVLLLLYWLSMRDFVSEVLLVQLVDDVRLVGFKLSLQQLQLILIVIVIAIIALVHRTWLLGFLLIVASVALI